MDPQNQKETGKFGDVTEALTTDAAGVPVDNTDDNAPKDAVEVDDNASEAASVQTVNTEQTISRTTEERVEAPSQSGDNPPSTTGTTDTSGS